MKLSHIAVAAAATIAGPTVFIAAPAVADDAKIPASAIPDATPERKKEDTSSASAEPTAEHDQATNSTALKPAPQETAPTPAAPAVSAPPSPDRQVKEDSAGTAPSLQLEGLPSTIVAGGDWTDFAFVFDNTAGTLEAQTLYLYYTGLPSPGDAQVQVYLHGAWREVEGDVVAHELEIPVGIVRIPARVKFAATVGNSDVQLIGHYTNIAELVSVWVKVVNEEDPGNGGEDPGNGGEDPGNSEAGTVSAADHRTTAGGGTTDAMGTGGRLAHTGADAATSWVLGAGGVALGLGAALIAGTGRRRRRTFH